jgi:multicomponent Na+:H+ antiporter subunit G
MSGVLDVVAAVLLLTGSSLALVAAIGLVRLPDVYARMHAATKPATLGISLCLTGAALRVDDVSDVAKIALAVAFQLLTNPVAAHLFGRAAHRVGSPQSEHTVVDELGAAAPHPDGPVP